MAGDGDNDDSDHGETAGRGVRLLLVRHGESHGNVDGTWDGHDSCRGLTARGRMQAVAVARWLTDMPVRPVDVLLSSMMPRARETADAIAASLGYDVERAVDCAFCELHPADASASTSDDEVRCRSVADAWYAPEGGESRFRFAVRVRRALAATARTYEGLTVAVVTHGGFITRACAMVEGEPFADALASGEVPQPANSSVTVLHYEGTAAGPRATGWVLERYAEAMPVGGGTAR